MMTTAKKAVSLGFLTHSLSQVFSSPLGPLLEESCPLRFFVPNKAAEEPNIAEIYARMGLTPQAIRTIATARPQRDIYYYCKETGQRLFHLPLGWMTQNCVARNRAEDHALMDAILAEKGREGFAREWLWTQGFPKEAAYVQRMHQQMARAPRPDAEEEADEFSAATG
jgi:type IV secretion system protein VirB4